MADDGSGKKSDEVGHPGGWEGPWFLFLGGVVLALLLLFATSAPKAFCDMSASEKFETAPACVRSWLAALGPWAAIAAAVVAIGPVVAQWQQMKSQTAILRHSLLSSVRREYLDIVKLCHGAENAVGSKILVLKLERNRKTATPSELNSIASELSESVASSVDFLDSTPYVRDLVAKSTIDSIISDRYAITSALCNQLIVVDFIDWARASSLIDRILLRLESMDGKIRTIRKRASQKVEEIQGNIVKGELGASGS